MPENSKPDAGSVRPLVTGVAATALSAFCHYLHIAVMLFIVAGWMVPVHEVLVGHVLLLPLVFCLWQVNQNSCPLNNIESLLTRGRWRDPDNREEGSFLVVIVDNYLGIKASQATMDAFTYGVMVLVWLFSLGHLHLRG